MARRRSSKALGVGIVALAWLGAGALQPWRLLAQAPQAAKGVKYAQVSPAEMKEWLTYLSSDELQGRQIFTEGYGAATQFIAERLKQWGVKPLGDDGTYFQMVKLKGYKVTRNSSVTVEVGGQSRTFRHGDHVTFSANSGGKQHMAFNGAEFVGYGVVNAGANYDDFKGRDVKDKFVVTMAGTPAALAAAAAGGGGRGGRGGRGGGAYAIATLGASAAVAFSAAPTPPSASEEALTKAQAALTQAAEAVTQAQQALQAQRAGRGAAFAGGRGFGGGRGAAPTVTPDITTVQKVDQLVSPQFTGDETFYTYLFSGGPVTFADLKAKADKGEPLPAMSLPNVKVSVDIDNTFETVSMQVSKNVVGMVEGSDPKLKDTYVMFGAHLDHIGYRTTPPPGGRAGGGGCRQTMDSAAARGRGAAAAGAPGAPAGQPPAPAAAVAMEQMDLVSNGADDDGSGSTSMLAIAKAFATGPKPKRSLVFVWHTGEEAGLYGSRYNADFPVVPLDKVQAQLNMDMVGRDDCNDRDGDYSNSVFIVGADRISTDLHNLIVETNDTIPGPLKLDYELNDPNDPESVYTRSDHYSYAAKGIPIAFFTTGLHPDYHRVSDTVDKILFPKMAKIAQLVYETGFSIANTDRVLERDNKGPRSGKGFTGKIGK